MQEIRLRGMRFHALVGILPHEREFAQPLEIDLTVRLRDGDAVVDYRALYEIVARVINSGPIDFLEEIGDRIARGALQHNARVQTARVAVRKPHVSLGGPLEFAEVVTELSLDD